MKQERSTLQSHPIRRKNVQTVLKEMDVMNVEEIVSHSAMIVVEVENLEEEIPTVVKILVNLVNLIRKTDISLIVRTIETFVREKIVVSNIARRVKVEERVISLNVV